MVKLRNVINLTSFSHFDMWLVVDYPPQVVLSDLALGGGGGGGKLAGGGAPKGGGGGGGKIADWRGH